MIDTESKEYVEALARLSYHSDAVWAGVMAKIPLKNITEESYLGMYKTLPSLLICMRVKIKC